MFLSLLLFEYPYPRHYVLLEYFEESSRNKGFLKKKLEHIEKTCFLCLKHVLLHNWIEKNFLKPHPALFLVNLELNVIREAWF